MIIPTILFSMIVMLLLFMLRLQIASHQMNKDMLVIFSYGSYLIQNGEYDDTFDYFNAMQKEFYSYIWDLTSWGKYSSINVEYRKILKEYVLNN